MMMSVWGTRILLTLGIIWTLIWLESKGLPAILNEATSLLLFLVFLLTLLVFGRSGAISLYREAGPGRALVAVTRALNLTVVRPLRLRYRKTADTVSLIGRADEAKENFYARYGEVWSRFVQRTRDRPIYILFDGRDDFVGQSLATVVRQLGLGVRVGTRDYRALVETGKEGCVLALTLDRRDAQAFSFILVTSLEDALLKSESFRRALEYAVSGLPEHFAVAFVHEFGKLLNEFSFVTHVAERFSQRKTSEGDDLHNRSVG